MDTTASDLTPTPELPERQAAILDYMYRYMQRWVVAPTVREIGRRFKISSTSVVSYHIRKLRAAGYLAERRAYGSRGNVPADAVVMRLGHPATVRTPGGEIVTGELIHFESVAEAA